MTRYHEGDRVYGFVKRDHIGGGTFAEYVVVPEDLFIGPAPARLNLSAAGVLGLSGITALECVDAVIGDGDAAFGAVVVVNGATGGVGCFAVQIAAARGAQVVATARSPQQAASSASSGATHVVDLSQEGLAGGDLVAQVRSAFPAGHRRPRRPGQARRLGDHRGGVRTRRADVRPALPRSAPRGWASLSVTNGGVADLLDGVAFTNVHSTPDPATIARLAALVDAGSGGGPRTPHLCLRRPGGCVRAAGRRPGAGQARRPTLKDLGVTGHPHDLPLDQARALVQRAVDKAEQLGLRGGIAVVGASGALVTASRLDHGGPGGMARGTRRPGSRPPSRSPAPSTCTG